MSSCICPLTSSSSMPMSTAARMDIHAPANVPSTNSLQSSNVVDSVSTVAAARDQKSCCPVFVDYSNSAPLYLGSFL